MRRKWWISSSITVLLVAGIAIVVTVLDAGKGSEGAPLRSIVLDDVHRDAVFAAVARKSAQEKSETIALTLPHHLLADDVIAEAVQSVRGEPNTIIIVGPDHQSRGSTYFTTTNKSFAWEGTALTTDTKLESALLDNAEFAESDTVVAAEHSVLIPAAFFHARFPSAKFVFITVRFGVHEEALAQLAKVLADQRGDDLLLVASIDFSHYKTFDLAEREDAETLRSIESGDTASFVNAAMDSPAALWLAFRYAELRGAAHPTVLDHKNFAEITGDRFQQETTSYFIIQWQL